MDSHVQSKLATLVLEVVGQPPSRAESSEVWSRLMRCELEIVLSFSTEHREYLVMRDRCNGPPPLSHRNRAILETVLIGETRKVVCFDLGLSSSTVGQILKTALQDMGLSCSPGRVPAMLIKIAHAARSSQRSGQLLARFISESHGYWVISDEMKSPLLEGLAPAERAVLTQIMCGRSYADIAAKRRTSYRTVANQVASACHRLGVSGRFHLLQRVATFHGQ